MAVANASLQALCAARGEGWPGSLSWGAGPTSLTTDFEVTDVGSSITGEGSPFFDTQYEYLLVLGPGSKALAFQESGIPDCNWSCTNGTVNSSNHYGCFITFDVAYGEAVISVEWIDGFNTTTVIIERIVEVIAP
jgi:hypothetical protein